MRKVRTDLSPNELKRMFESGNLSFDYPIQRKPGQWNLFKQSELIHSFVCDDPIPDMYAVQKDGIIYIIDGSQRLTSVFSYIDNEYKCHPNTPNAKMDLYNMNIELSNKDFSQLDEAAQNKILNEKLNVYILENATYEDIERVIRKLNNGSPMTNSQKIRGVLGKDLSKTLKEIAKKKFFEQTKLTPKAIDRHEDEAVIIQTHMLFYENDWNKLNSRDVLNYSEVIRREDRVDCLQKISEAIDYLIEVLDIAKQKFVFSKELTRILRKAHLPMIIYTAIFALENNVTARHFAEWLFTEMNDQLNPDFPIDTGYKKYCGHGSTAKVKVLGRRDYMMSSFEKNLKKSV
ncbi:DUF262 domain-containing protein [Bacillus sonorensis]|uniref:DUF262 domain-containing protein n=2 Tax=Bacillus TaxID=1386 RepID=A0A0T6BM89_9BACI|nr:MULTISPECIES: DUF262 domain-containing protein [Bacillus]EME72289.1 hypothetical protein BSONL12_23365 [Bacillus sonorensis L12]KRT92717.1 hypothetical protein AB447_222315 [Bacillus glycinifermentans]MCZ0075384.1 DUF262 domain-containing protein [Bacillus sonorensis]MCZ0093039.1 DUF262 domain-containing protein [Bacillus sonorensis]MEC0483411.1 DUF262 domain-containing protein [Bacillus glycinifermentans]